MSGSTPATTSGPRAHALSTLLGILALMFVVAAVLYEIGPLWLPNKDFFQQLPFVSNSVVKVGILLSCCLYARGDLRERRGLVVIVLVAHVISVAAMAILLVGMDTSRVVNPGVGAPQPVGKVMIGAMILDGVIFALLGILYLLAKQELPQPAAPPHRADVANYLTPAEQWLRRVLIGLGVLFIAGAIIYEAGPLSGTSPEFFRELPFVTNSVVKVSTLSMVCFYVAKSLRPRMSLVGPVIAVHFVSCIAQLIYLWAADPEILARPFVILGQTQTMTQILSGAIVLDGVLGAALMALYFAAWRSRLACQFLRPVEYRTLIALSEVMTEGPDVRVPPEEAARNVDRALAAMATERTALFQTSLAIIHYFPLLALWPPLPDINSAARADYIKRRFKREAGKPALLSPIRTILQAFTRVAHQLAVLGYYSDARAFDSIGYTPFSRRPRYQSLHVPDPEALPLKVEEPWDITSEVIETEVLVIGTGAGGATIAYGLAEQGKQVLLVERGKYVEPRAFAEHELTQLGNLYDGGLLEVASDFRFGVLQGSCVGGSTTVNNAICFEPPSKVVDHWNAGFDAGIDRGELANTTRWIRDFMQVKRLGESGPPFQFHGGVQKLAAGITHLGPEFGLTAPQAFEANIKQGPDGCYGCGKCNIGCPYDKKLSMLVHTLPMAQHKFGSRVRILANCEVKTIRAHSGKPQHVVDVKARLSDGRWVTIKAETYVLAAGALASSYLMLNSGIGRGLPVGKGLCFNMVAPVLVEFPEAMNSYDGIQMGHYVNDRVADRFLIETWYSLPVGLALSMGGWFDEHYRNMRRAGSMAAYGLVVGTDRASNVFVNPMTGDLGFNARPTASDMTRMVESIDRLGRLVFAAGAKRMIINTWDHGTVNNLSELPALLTEARDPRFISLASAHPQGGNAISRDPARGVIDENFRVHGYGNLYVADASVFPSSLQVNPQMTVMAMARYAAARIGALTK